MLGRGMCRPQLLCKGTMFGHGGYLEPPEQEMYWVRKVSKKTAHQYSSYATVFTNFYPNLVLKTDVLHQRLHFYSFRSGVPKSTHLLVFLLKYILLDLIQSTYITSINKAEQRAEGCSTGVECLPVCMKQWFNPQPCRKLRGTRL